MTAVERERVSEGESPVGSYFELNAADETTVRADADAIRSSLKLQHEMDIEIGRRLDRCKKLFGHGNWLAWLRKEFEWSEDKAQRFMRAAKVLGDKPHVVSALSRSACHELVAAPPKVRDEIVAEVEAGREPPTVETIRAGSKAAKADARAGKSPVRAPDTATARSGMRRRKKPPDRL